MLIIDDEPDTLWLLAELLDREGYVARTASDGLEALELLRTIRPEAILLDIQMPRMDGAQFRQAQRQDRELVQIPTAVMTGSDAEMQLDLAVEATLQKPVRRDALLAFVGRHCTPSSLAARRS